ncbi:TonB-dependent receptor [uncultured Caulobacter sp.]|uniref:TonB-dependent receptor n=1 Tax=uncultured Caulobacter sp. TaxID=158749 RepID=UPI0026279100|nr:TonB-dependent receptor [uncultured Caulobacter sp.]
MRKLAGGAALAVLAMASANAVYAQETTGGIGGRVTGPDGAPLGNVTVVVTNVPSNTKVTTVTSADGYYAARSLRVGGPYTVVVSDPAFQGKSITVDNIEAGAPVSLDIALAAADNAVAQVVVTAAASGARTIETGPRSSFSARDVESLPSFSRDLKDLARLNPFVQIDPTNSNALIVAGTNNRYNTIYIDGVQQSDNFGLNGNGYPSQRSPISLELVRSFNFEVAPYDVQYGAFQGGVMNIVTKSGGNSFHGSVYADYDSSRMAGRHFSSIYNDPTTGKPRDFTVARFEDKTYGVTLNGPIIKDRLFFSAGYEKGEYSQASDAYGPGDSNAANRVPGVTVAQVQQIQSTLKSVYNYDTLGYGATLPPQTDKKYFLKLDGNITDKHRAVFEYAREENNSTFNGGTNNATNLSLLSEYYNKPEVNEVYIGQLFSQWTDQFSTTLEYSRKEVSSIRQPLGGTAFANFQVRIGSTNVLLGPDISSQANVLDNVNKTFKIKGVYKVGDHVFSAGFQREQLDVFNQFVQRANGSYLFDATCGARDALINLANRTACSLTYNNAADNNAVNGAAKWNAITNTIYAQDEYTVMPGLTVRVGVRADFFDSDTKPNTNARFVNQYGIPNNATFKGAYSIMPRFGFNWRPDDRTVLTGGFGLFSGGSPNVWLSNSYSNTGNLLGSVSCTPTQLPSPTAAAPTACSSALLNVDGFKVADAAKQANTNSANLGTGIANAVDPTFRIPAVWKYSLSAARYVNLPFLGDDYRFHGDVLYQKVKYGITWRDLYADANKGAPAPDGRPTYLSSRTQNTNAAFYDLLLTNVNKGGGTTYAVGVGKDWKDGWAQGLNFDVTYTRVNVKETSPGTSSVALSNYSQWAIADRDNPEVATSNYQIKYSTKLTVGYRRAFFGDYETSARFFIQRRAGLPFSYTFDAFAGTNAGQAEQAFGETGDVAFRDTQLFYVPKADSSGNITMTSDPIVRFNNAADAAKLDAFVKQTGLAKYAGQISPRNAFKSRDLTTMDVRLQQELPAFFPGGSKLKATLDIINLGNLINKKWGVLEQYAFPYRVNVVQATNCQPAALANPSLSAAQRTAASTACSAGPGNYYQYNSISSTTTPTVNASNQSSTWYIKFGLKYEF